MEDINLLVSGGMDEAWRQRIASVSPRIKITDISKLTQEERGQFSSSVLNVIVGDEAGGERRRSQKFTFIPPRPGSELDALLAEAEIIYGYQFPQNLMARTPKLKWIQLLGAGVNQFLDAGMMARPVKLTNMSGIADYNMAELVFTYMLMFVKKMPLAYQLKEERDWRRGVGPDVLRGKTVGILGLGIGGEVARLAKRFDMRVLATRRSAKPARNVDVLLPPSQLPQLLAESDFVVIALPLTKETHRVIGEKELRAMKPTAYILNIARGDIIDEKALIRALQENWIAGAGLDTVDAEPLVKDSPLWEMPNVILTPHIGGSTPNRTKATADFFVDNLQRYLSGKRLRNLVDKKRGY